MNRDIDVEEVYLSKRELETVPDFSHYRNLKRLYLNNNQFLHLSYGLKFNYILTELYLQNNKLVNINGYLEHLRFLEILLLHGNQLTSLTDVNHELRHMMDLKVLNLMNNPLAQEYDYRDSVIHNIKSLELFDRRAVKKSERDKVFVKYEIERQAVKDTIAFGRRCVKELPTATTHENNKVERHDELNTVQGGLSTVGTNDVRSIVTTENADEIIMRKNMTSDQKYAKQIESRANKRAVMQVKVFDWLDVLQSREKECEKEDVAIYVTKLK